MTDKRPPKDNIVRAMPSGYELRESADAAPTLAGHFAVFDQWTEISSAYEGRFLERIAPGAFSKTIAENGANVKVLFNHGQDPTMGDQILGVPTVLEEDDLGARYEVPLLDGVPTLIRSGLAAKAYGASFRFAVVREDYESKPKKSDANPTGLPERTVREAKLFEFGPVTFPAYAGATASVRSMTDEYLRSLLAERAMAMPTTESEMRAHLAADHGMDATDMTMTQMQDAHDAKHAGGASHEHAARSAPSVDAGASPHLEPERREPEVATPTETTEYPPAGGSPDSRSNEVEYLTRDDKSARVTELRATIARRAVEYPGVLPDEIQSLDDAENAEHDALVRDIEAWDKRQDRIRSFGTDDKLAARHTEPGSAPAIIRTQSLEDIHDLGKIRSETRSREEYDRKVRENALRSIDQSRLPKSANGDGLVDLIENRDAGEEGEGEMARRVLLTGSPVYKRAFSKYLAGQKDLWSPEESRAAALAVTGTTTTGGYAVPYVFDPTMIHLGVYTATNPFRQACRVETITNGNNWRTVTVGAVTSVYITEAGAATEQGPTFGQPTYTVQSAHAFATVSHETLQDRPDISGELTSVFAESKATYEENQFAVGVGTTVFPLGMFTDTAYTNQDTATNDVTAIADILVLEGILPLRFRANGAFFMNRSTIRQLQALDTTYRYFSGSNIQYSGGPGFLTPGSSSGGNTGLQLLGYPVWEVPSAVSTLTTDGAIIVVFCDPKSYVIVDRLGMSVEVIPNMLNGATPSFPTGQRGIYARWRNTAKPIAADAGRSLSVQ